MTLQDFLRDELVPFWLTQLADSESGGYRTLSQEDATPHGGARWFLTEHADTLRSCAELYRSGIAGDTMLDLARNGMDFLLDHFCDGVHGGWFHSLDHEATPFDHSKHMYAQTRVLQALNEYGMASGDPRAAEWAVSTFQICQTFAADNHFGGYIEHFARDWSHVPDEYGAARKSFRSHTNYLYALTAQYEATGASIYAQKSAELLQLISTHFLHPEHGTGIPWCAPDWSPVGGISDEGGGPADARDDNNRIEASETHYGWNMEFIATAAHSRKFLETTLFPEIPMLRSLCDNTLQWGINLKRGLVFGAGPQGRPPMVERAHAGMEGDWAVLVGLLDAYIVYEDPRYLDAYESIFSSSTLSTVEGTPIRPSSVRWLLRLEEQLLKITL